MPTRLAQLPAYAGLAAGGAAVGVLGAFLHPARVRLGGVGIPLLVPVVLAALLLVVVGGAAVVRSRAGAVLPAAAWVACTLLFATPRPEGDLVVSGSAVSVAYLVLGTIVAGLGIGLPPGFVRGLRRARPARTDGTGSTGNGGELASTRWPAPRQ